MFASGKDNTCIDFLPLELRDTCGFPFSAFSFSLSFGFAFPGTTISLLLPPASETLERRVIIRHPLLLVKKKEENSLLTEWIYFILPCVCQEKEKDIQATGEDFVSHFGVFRDSWLKWSRRNNIYLLDAWSLVLFSSSLTAPCCFFLFFRSLNFPNLEKRLENIFKSGCHVKQSDENNVCTSPGENLCVQIWIIVLYVFSWPRPFGKISFFEGSNQKCEIPADVKQNVK